MRTYLGRYPCGRCDETCRLVRVRYDRALGSRYCIALCRHVFSITLLYFFAAEKAAEQHVADRHCLLIRRKCKFK